MKNTTDTQTNASAATTAQTPNYRIYDRTGGGVTEDIYAESLDDAIEQGREWIKAGDWSGCGGDDEDGGETYRTMKLECCVGEIVRDEDGEIDSRATFDGAHDCSGTHTPDMPECEMAEHASEDDTTDDEGHVWREPFSAVGGCKENPGVWSGGGTRMSYHSVCRLCGCHKHTSDPGCQRNPDEATETVTIKPRDEASEAWLKRTHEENGWIPEWLAEMLGCSPSVKMTEEQAREYVASHDDSDELDDDDLEHAFAGIFNRRPDDEDRAQGLWSHLCAAAGRLTASARSTPAQ